ncbi:MAG: chemotaxis protein CheW [Velocimicrobium sp.]
MASKRIVFFKIGGQVYGLDVLYTQGIERLVNLMPVPNTLSHIKGLINLRGEVIPVYSLRKKFGMPEVELTESTQMIITKLNNGIFLAFEVDNVQEITEITDNSEVIAPALIMSGDTGYIEKVVHIEKNLAILINPEGILTEEEKENVRKYLEKLKKEA